ncbi:hypothetical protein C5E07_13645 [Pseudoclavibacter sp. RFBJ3]|nr:hypothetical protein C5C12_12720 [Pseudoclavibacter sp. RFBJ5]PPF91225.1 hypothetical protein C5E07_13645 [Pseudoclavibacter sp. RFBJ3]PPF96164.1 hypothetical protein C5C19_16180 [Pseudoclavibacter sp. RFBH5]PPG21405.1 hypothetical protein C5E13_12970 [Pseudoclavibacter sp. RFBI4]
MGARAGFCLDLGVVEAEGCPKLRRAQVCGRVDGGARAWAGCCADLGVAQAEECPQVHKPQVCGPTEARAAVRRPCGGGFRMLGRRSCGRPARIRST